ncbi:DNA recombination protein RmuC [Sphingomonas floccifaciens]|uniref:DNA recombination protein RmuC n=1 Tax=Sphingomonas floccifaciens TaxID=1844115 RepID=A0ABW4NCW6_9SPHN
MVEFAVKLPGSGEAPLWLPIDAKFPQEDYDRLLLAQDGGVADDIERAGAALERAIRVQANPKGGYNWGFELGDQTGAGHMSKKFQRPTSAPAGDGQ